MVHDESQQVMACASQVVEEAEEGWDVAYHVPLALVHEECYMVPQAEVQSSAASPAHSVADVLQADRVASLAAFCNQQCT